MAAGKDTHSRGLLKKGAWRAYHKKEKAHPEYSGWGQFLEGAYMALLIPMRMSHQFMGYAVMKPQTMPICIMSQKTG